MQPDKQDIVMRLKEIISTDLGMDISPQEIDDEDGFMSKLGVDSMGFVELKFQCEEVFGISINDDEFVPDNFTNCATLAAFVLTKTVAADLQSQ
ncbi:Coronafacic acid synthetase, acyl carrier protein component [Thiomonas sp. X19]|nr:Coronafacic acid synthetase, acyl carrier protein component [Thiomonas sp. X19]